MTPTQFRIDEHVIDCQNIREYAHAVKSDGKLRLAVKQYTPLIDNSDPNSISIIAAHGNGIPKECYEPLWEELLQTTSIPIKSIWIADCSNQGASGVINENITGHDSNWFDHSRDLLHMVNHFRDRISPPIFGIAHSFGCSQFVHLSLMHPSLFQGLAFLEPMVQRENPSKMTDPTQASFASNRQDIWPSRASAETALRKTPFFRTWDLRAVNKYISFGLRSIPTAAYPASAELSPSSVTLTTSKAQEAWTYLGFNSTPQSEDHQEYLLGKDMSRKACEGHLNNRSYVTNCPSAPLAFENLSYIRPPVLYLFGEKSHINPPERREDKLQVTGTGTGGNGGVIEGRVEGKIIPACSHMMPLQRASETAALLARWLENQMEDFESERRFQKEYDSGKSQNNQTKLSEKWIEYTSQPAGAIRPVKSSL